MNQTNEEFKEMFWEWLYSNTYFYLSRTHHKDDIEKAIDYCIDKQHQHK